MTLQIDKILDPAAPEENSPEMLFEDVDLAGVSWNYRLRWNDRAERWILDVYTSDGTKRINGKRLVPNYLLNQFHTGRRPEGGYMLLLDTGDPDGNEACTFDGLGNRWKLCWLVDDGVDTTPDRPWSITVP